MRNYFIALGVDGLFLFLTVYYVVCFTVLKLGPRPEYQGNAAPDKPNEN
jgi:hypothetical protein